ncbi:probable myosin light chain kinase DDB_G0292624 [Caerostris extrusa]|uniref:Probable myosin light chain kinase DDB_G0292624 n=1 Tax=Caerostris extrusa TaxID=172846 RepID=A0AAV4PB12_CAEEX|nr:probable myosin light chain kinase DDB_G0292624 [Caerostris extrusa]
MNNDVVSESILTEFQSSSDYKVFERLGHGAYGMVFLVRDKRSRQKVAAKLVMKSTSGERELWPTLNHPNLLPILRTDFFLDDCVIFLMPYVGCDLFNVLYEKVPNFHSDSRCFIRKKRYMKDILKGLEYMHNKKLCHLDLKEENILICYKTDSAVLGDFSTLNLADEVWKRTFGLNLFALPPEAASRSNNVFYDGIAAEMWTFGILVLQVFTMKYHFREVKISDTYEDILPKVMSATFHRGTRQMFQPTIRYSATKALKHPFLLDIGGSVNNYRDLCKPKALEEDIISQFERLSLNRPSPYNRDRNMVGLMECRLRCYSHTIRDVTQLRSCSKSYNATNLRKSHSWPSLLKFQNSLRMDKHLEYLKSLKWRIPTIRNIQPARKCKKYTPRFKRRKAILSSPQEVYHRFEIVPEIQFSYNSTANVNGGVIKFTGSSSPGIVKVRKRPKRSKLWNLSKIWKITKVEQYYDSFAEDLILLSSM